MSTQEHLVLTIHASALADADSRPITIARGMEQALPGLRLNWELSSTGQPIALKQRDNWLDASTLDGQFPILCNGDENYPIMLHGMKTLAGNAPGGQVLCTIHAQLPLDASTTTAATSILENIAEAASAFWGHLSQGGLGLKVSEQRRHSAKAPEHSPHGLPMLELPWKLSSPAIPSHLGWLNYWSEAAARAIGFPDPARDADLLSRARRTASGGWVVPITDTPLDFDIPAHLDALRRAYERLPVIGGRALPWR
jgi:hypothetical protein